MRPTVCRMHSIHIYYVGIVRLWSVVWENSIGKELFIGKRVS